MGKQRAKKSQSTLVAKPASVDPELIEKLQAEVVRLTDQNRELSDNYYSLLRIHELKGEEYNRLVAEHRRENQGLRTMYYQTVDLLNQYQHNEQVPEI